MESKTFTNIHGITATLILGDCLEVLPSIPKVDCVVSDPPYGIDYKSTLVSLGATERRKIHGDEKAICLRWMLNMDCGVLSFGANNYPEQLPHRGRWLCWDKRTIDGACDAMLGSPIELAWSNKVSGYDKIVRCLHGGVVNADGGKRVHPTQKPVKVMAECIAWMTKAPCVILDPFMGSGTTMIAALRTGRHSIGIEIDPEYYRIACERVERELDGQLL